MHGELTERLYFAFISPNDIIPYSPDFVLHIFRVPQWCSWKQCLDREPEGTTERFGPGKIQTDFEHNFCCELMTPLLKSFWISQKIS